MQLHAGVARTEITPPLGVHLFGYPDRDRFALSAADPLHSTALVVESGGKKAAIASLDLCLLDDETVTHVRSRVEERTGIPAEQVTLCCIQTHSAPNTVSATGWGDRDDEYLSMAVPWIVESVVQADRGLKPARLLIGTTRSDVGINRRQIAEDDGVVLGQCPWGAYDPEMTVLRLEGAAGPIGSIVHYGAHPTSRGSTPEISRDWPGVMVDRLEETSGAPAMFVNGAVGDVGPRLDAGGTVGNGQESMMEMGTRAANDAIRAYHAAAEIADADLDVAVDSLHLPYGPRPPLDQAIRERERAEPHKAEWGAGMADYFYWNDVVESYGKPTVEGKWIRQTITRLGPAVFVPVPGEPFAEIVLRIRQASPFPYTMVASTTNGCNGYFVTRESRPRGGYEVWVGRAYGAYLFNDNIDDVLVAENRRLLKRMYNKND